MRYRGKVDYACERKMRERNKSYYRLLHWPLWIGTFFVIPAPLVFNVFAHGFGRISTYWLLIVIVCTGVAGLYGKLPGMEHRPYILRFDEDRPNPLYRRICYAFAWNVFLSFTALNFCGLVVAAVTHTGYLRQIYAYGDIPITLGTLSLGAMGVLPRVRSTTRGEGRERRHFYATVWATTLAQTVLLILWRILPPTEPTTNLLKLVGFTATLSLAGLASKHGLLVRTRPILPGEAVAAD